MLQSSLFTKTKREAPRDEEAINAKLLIRAGFIDKLMAGVYTFLPLGLRVLKKIEDIVREEMNAAGGQEVSMSVLHPKENWETTGRWQSFEALFKLKSRSEADYALGPTHEEIIYPLLKHYVYSYKDLPIYVYQIQTKFRDEPRAKSGLLRGREFKMKDLYSFHVSDADRDKYYEVMKKAYFNVFKRMGIDAIWTEASGGTFSNRSHEFQVISSAGEDTIHICEKCRTAINDEITEEQKVCPKCGGKNFRKEKAIEIGNIFPLKENYAREFNLTFKDENGEERLVSAGCYGLGISRLMGAIVEVLHDTEGIIWPESVAPFKVHLICVKCQASGIKKFADKIYNSLQKNGIEVLYDDREEASAGEKFADADLIGIPYRLVVSEKTGDQIEIKKRNEEKTKLAKEKELIKLLQ
jgi:prolyl-tRNA synthetase